MTSVTGDVAVVRRAAWPAYAIAACVTFAGLVALRAAGLHDGLLYPDGYQYLLMARGIAEHFEPVTTLGPGGDVFAPNADAALKPLFPALVAVASLFGASPLDAARGITALAGAAVPLLTGLLALRLGAGRAAAAGAVVVCAFSPTLVHWSGYAGPDPLAQALALGAALALLHRRPVVGGALVGLCMVARVDYAVVALAVFAAALVARSLRREAMGAATSAVVVVAATVVLTRPPIAAPSLDAIAGGVVLGLLSACLLIVATRVGAVWGACIAIAVVAPLALLDGGAWTSVARQDWPLIILALTGLALCLREPATRATALRVLALSLPLAALYWVKNPALARYVAQLVPELALLAAVGLGTVNRARVLVGTAAAGLVAAGVLVSSQPAVGTDGFRELAPVLEHAPAGALVTATPDAYGFLLPRRTVHDFRPGAEGLVLVDGAARGLTPGLRVDGKLLRRIEVITGFLRPDGVVDRVPVLLYRGRVAQGP